MEKDVTISARIPKKLAAKVDLLAKQYQRSKSWLVEDAVRQYVIGELEFLEAVEEGRRDIRAGRVYTHEEAMAQLKRRRKKLS